MNYTEDVDAFEQLLRELGDDPELEKQAARDANPDAPDCFLDRIQRVARWRNCVTCELRPTCSAHAGDLARIRDHELRCLGSGILMPKCAACSFREECEQIVRASGRVPSETGPLPLNSDSEIVQNSKGTPHRASLVEPVAETSARAEPKKASSSLPLTSAPSYRFVRTDEFSELLARARTKSLPELRARLNALAPSEARCDVDAYIAARDELCAVAWALNERKEMPPFLRPWYRPPKPSAGRYSSNAQILANDLRVLDVHWLHCTGRLRSERLLTISRGFDLDACEAWAGAKKVGIDRANELSLSESEARELAICRPKHVSDQQVQLRERLRMAPCRIRTALEAPGNRMKEDPATLERLAEASLIAGASWSRIAELLPRLGVRMLTMKQIKSREEWLVRNGVLPR